MNNQEIKKRIETVRKEKHISQADIAERLSISQTAYYKIEKGSTCLISDRISQIASVLQVREEELVLGYDANNIQHYKEIIEQKDRRIMDLEKIIEDKNKIIELLQEKIEK